MKLRLRAKQPQLLENCGCSSYGGECCAALANPRCLNSQFSIAPSRVQPPYRLPSHIFRLVERRGNDILRARRHGRLDPFRITVLNLPRS